MGMLAACSGAVEPVAQGLGPGLEQSGRIECVEPCLREELGPIESSDWGEAWQIQPGMQLSDAGGGVVVADLNGDGWQDVFLPSFGRCVLFMGVDGQSFSDQTDAGLPAVELCRSIGGSAADVDGDGDLDLFLAVVDARNRLYLNDGTGTFTDVTESSGLLDEAVATMGASWADMDGDGDLDLFVANHGSRQSAETRPPNPGADNRLYENQGGVFVDVSERLSVEDRQGYSFLGGWFDVNADGSPDLQIINDFGLEIHANRLLLNDGTGHFEAVPSSDLALAGDAMGLAIGDLNEDGTPDFAISDWQRIHLRISLDSMSWVDQALVRGLTDRPESQLVGWGTQFGDVDNDADLDLWMGFGYILLEGDRGLFNPEEQPDALWLQDEQGYFEDIAPSWGVDADSATRGGLLVDLNGDGSLDLIRRQLRTGPAEAWRSRCGEGAWLEVSLAGEAPNTFGIGAQIAVTVGGQTQRRWIESGSTSVMSSGPPLAHFGLGSAEVIDELVIYWPDGLQTHFHGIEARQRLVVHESEVDKDGP